MVSIAKYIVVFFGLFLIGVGVLMLFNPSKAREYLRMAGSTNFINYAEITIRMIPAAGLVLYAEHSAFPEIFKYLGWFMIGTSVVLYFIPRKIHHAYALKSADILRPTFVRIISPVSILFGIGILYSVTW